MLEVNEDKFSSFERRSCALIVAIYIISQNGGGEMSISIEFKIPNFKHYLDVLSAEIISPIYK